jgi:aryl-alcohol dehydrogenase-like predicted oxidoreductase
MQMRPLGRTGLMVSAIGFGGWGIGGATPGPTSYGDTDDATSLAALDEAIRLGITFFDTANVYGNGRSERLIGRALAGRREGMAICTKAGCKDFAEPLDFSPDAIRSSVSGSLERLGTGWIDLLLLHNPLPDEPGLDATFATLRALRDEGLLRHFGVSLRGPEHGDAFIAKYPDIVALEVNLNLMDQRAVGDGLLERAQAAGVAVIARTPLCFGFLTGTIAPDATFAPADQRSRWSPAQVACWSDGAREFHQRFGSEGETATDLALRYCTSFPAVAAAIPGILTPEEARINVRAGVLGPLPSETLAGIAQLYGQRDYFVRPPNWVPPMKQKG